MESVLDPTANLAALRGKRDALKRAQAALETDGESRKAHAEATLASAGDAAASGSPIRKILDGILGGRNPILGGRDHEAIDGIAAKLKLRLLDVDVKIAKEEEAERHLRQIGINRDVEDLDVATEDSLRATCRLAVALEGRRAEHSGGLAVPTVDVDIEPLIRLLREIELHRGSSSGGRDCRTFADADGETIRGYRNRQDGEGKE